MDTIGRDIFATAKKTYVRLAELSKEKGIELIHVELKAEGKKATGHVPQLDFLEREFFSTDFHVRRPKYLGTPEGIRIFEAKELWTELDHAARQIIKLCREEGYRFNEISVVTGDIESYGRFLENVFKQYEIPIFLDERKKIAHHPLLTAISSIFDIQKTNWTYESFFRLLKSGYWGLAAEEVDVLENFCLKYGVKGDYLKTDRSWGALLERLKERKKAEEDLALINNLRSIAVEPLQEYYRKDRLSGRRMAEAFYHFIDEVGIPEKLLEETERFLAEGDENSVNLQERMWSGILNILEQIAEISGDEAMTIGEFGELVHIGFQELGAGMAPAAVDQVLVGDLDRSRHHKVRALFVLGVNEETFPAVVPKFGIISDRERRFLEEKGCRLAPDTTAAIFEKEYLVYRTFSAPTEKLFLSYPAADLSGGAKRPARVIKELRECFPGLPFMSEIYEDEPQLDYLSMPVPTMNKLFGTLVEGKQLNKLEISAMAWFETKPEWRDAAKQLQEANDYTTASRGITGEALKLMAGGDLYSSVSRLEAYQKCPFSWFVEGALRAKDREVFQLNLMDIGNFIHELVYETITTAASMGKTMGQIGDEELEAIEEKLFQLKCEEGVMTSKGRYRYISNRLNRVAKRSLRMVNDHFRKSRFTNFGNELDFGSDSKLGDAGIRLSDGSMLRLKGRIDRLDLYQKGENAYCRIVDYKTGNKIMSLADVYHGLELQLLGYMNCISGNGLQGVGTNILPGAVLYFHLDDPMIKGKKGATAEEIEKEKRKQLRMSGLATSEEEVYLALDCDALTRESSMDISERKGLVTPEEFGILCDYARKKIRNCGEGIKAGDVSVSPICRDGEFACIYCRFKSICKFDPALPGNEGRLIRKMSDKVALERILREEV